VVHRAWVVFVCASALLIGCSSPPPGAGAIVGTAVEPGGAPVLGVGLMMVDLALAPTAVAAAELIEIGTGQYATGLVPVAADGSFRLPLPTAAELPDGVLSPADDFLANVQDTADCDLVADPASARVSDHVFDEFGVAPGFYGVSLEGLALSLATETAVDMGDLANYVGRFLVWLYADGPVAIETVGIGCAGNVVVDVELETGWNVAAWTYDKVLDQLALGDAPSPGAPIVTLFPQTAP
jgi:hypothetical protein